MMNKSVVGSAALMLGVCAPLTVGFAQTADEAKPAEAESGMAATTDTEGAEPLRLGTVSVTATLNPVRTFSFPGMVSVVGRDRILSQMASSPDDVLKLVPGVEFAGGPRRTGEVPSIRGFSGPDVVVLLDGARQNFNAGHDGRFFIDPSLLREVEVLRGSSSSLYGSGGTGGVIALRTVNAEDFLSPWERYGYSVSTGYQSVNREKVGTVTVFGRPTDELDIVASVTRRASGSIELGDGTKRDRSDDDIVSALFKAGVEVADFHHVEASFQRFDNDAEEPNNGQGAGDTNLVEKDIRSDNWRLSYRYDDPGNHLVNLDAVLYYTATRADELRLDGNGLGPAGELLERDVDTTGFRIDNRSRFMLGETAGVTFTYGMEGYGDKQAGAAGGGPRDGVPDAETEFFGVYSQAEVKMSRPLGVLPGEAVIIPGIRYDHYEATSAISSGNEDQAVSPRIGVSYMPTTWSLLFANYGKAFRAPAVDELFLDGIHFPLFLGIVNRFVANPDLRPQKTKTFEFGGGFNFQDVVTPGDYFEVKVSHYRIKGEDFIDLDVIQPEPFVDCNPIVVPGSCDGTTRSVNVPQAELRGTEVEMSYEDDRLRLGLGFSTVDGENEITGEKLGVLTPPELTVDAALKLPEFDSVAGWRMIAASEFDKTTDPAEIRGGYAVHDIFYAWQPAQGPLAGLRLDLGIDNVFDKAYDRVFTTSREPGRNYKALVSYTQRW
ncbi:MAG: TonB-dependent receptor [Rhodospirillaceae bacterium]|nr:TonB-dependent receptor [Rhodospirillaceae bacterium]